MKKIKIFLVSIISLINLAAYGQIITTGDYEITKVESTNALRKVVYSISGTATNFPLLTLHSYYLDTVIPMPEITLTNLPLIQGCYYWDETNGWGNLYFRLREGEIIIPNLIDTNFYQIKIVIITDHPRSQAPLKMDINRNLQGSVLSLPATGDKSVAIEYSRNVNETNQWKLLTNLAPGTPEPISIIDTNKDDRRFYRAKGN